MDDRRRIMISWKRGFDFGDRYGPAFRRLAAKIIRKRVKRIAQKEIDQGLEDELIDRYGDPDG